MWEGKEKGKGDEFDLAYPFKLFFFPTKFSNFFGMVPYTTQMEVRLSGEKNPILFYSWMFVILILASWKPELPRRDTTKTSEIDLSGAFIMDGQPCLVYSLPKS